MAAKLAAGLDRPSHSEAANAAPRHKGWSYRRVIGPAYSSPGLPRGTPLTGCRAVRTRPPYSSSTNSRRLGRPDPQRPLSALGFPAVYPQYQVSLRTERLSLWCANEPSGV